LEQSQRASECTRAADTSHAERTRFDSRDKRIAAHASGPLPERRPGRGQLDLDGALVVGAALAADQAGAFQALQQRRERPRVQLQGLTERGHALAAVLPQHQHDQVLRVGQAQRVEQRPVGLGDGPRGRIEIKAELIGQFELLKLGRRSHGLLQI
jgi:hypothetical protein